MTGSLGISRRHVLTIAAGAAGASITGATAVIGTSTPAQAAKVSQKIVKYQDTPKGEQRCDNCELFEPPLVLQKRRWNYCCAGLVHRL
jgi:hypothetical protein